jgi:hypothetical protein
VYDLWGVAWPIALGAAGTVVGWIILEFVGRPIRRFFDLKAEVVRQSVVFGNVSAKWKQRTETSLPVRAIEDEELTPAQESRLQEAIDTFRDLGAQMRAFADSETLAIKALLVIGYNPLEAAKLLIGFSNNISTYGQTRANTERALRAALKLSS